MKKYMKSYVFICGALLVLSSGLTHAMQGQDPAFEAELVGMILNLAPDGGDENPTPLHIAAARGDREQITLLLDNGANIEARTRSGDTPLSSILNAIYTDKARRMAAAQLLLERGANPNVNDSDNTPLLHRAIMADDEEFIRLLLEYGTDLEARDIFGFTPLFIAAASGNEKIVRILLEHGANARVLFILIGETPLMAARRNEHNIVVAILEEHLQQSDNRLTPR